jgi:uncharacterized protein (DUF362 family)
VDPRNVVISRPQSANYPEEAPFHPSERYPEYLFGEEISPATNANAVYDGVRQLLQMAELDCSAAGTPQWNPLSEFIRPGQCVLIKPNLVKETHPRDPLGWRYTITHGSVIRAVADYAFKALEGRGTVVVADAPQTDSDFSTMVRLLQLDRLQEFYRRHGMDFELTDLRKEQWKAEGEVVVERRKLAGDPRGYIAFDLADRSEFHGHCGEGRYYGADYDDGEVNRHHTGGRHEYLIAGTAIKCDVFINVPKLKTHKKAGITVNLKNLVGVNGDKNWLPHHTCGTPADGGDQFPVQTLKRSIEHSAARALRRVALAMPGLGPWALQKARRAGKQVFGDTESVVRSGNWYGNDTTWRMCLDLNKLVLYGNSDGSLRAAAPEQRKPYLSIVDGVLGGQGRGPMNPDPLESRALMFGANPASVDAAAAILMSFDIRKIPIVLNAFRARGFPLTEWDWQNVQCISNFAPWNGSLAELQGSEHLLQVNPHFGWIGHIEQP